MASTTPIAQLRVMEDDELVIKLTEAKEELFNLRFQAATGQLDSHGRLRAVRHEIARVYTIMRERELGITPIDDETGNDETGNDETGNDETGNEGAA